MKDFGGYDKYRYDSYTVLGRISTAEEHAVEDARSLPSVKQKPEKSPKESPKRKKRSALFVVMVTLLCFSATLIAADLIGNHSALASYVALFGKNKQRNGEIYYAVYATHSADMGVSYKNAGVIRAEGGAGYVLKKGDEYYVILNAYEDKEQAESVAGRQANYGILEIECPAFTVGKSECLAAAEESKDLYHECFLSLYQAANDLASGKYAKADMKRALAQEKERVSAKESAYAERIRGKEDTVGIEYKILIYIRLDSYQLRGFTSEISLIVILK